MAYREVMMLEVKEILRLWLAGFSKRQISAQLGFDVKTVRRYVAAAEAAGLTRAGGVLDDSLVASILTTTRPLLGRPHGESWATCDSQRSLIEHYLSEHVRLSKIGKLLARQGTPVAYPTLRRFAIAELGFGRTAPTVPVADCTPGEEVQLDTGWMTLLEPDLFGKRRRFRAWIFTPVLSRYRFVYPVFHESTATASPGLSVLLSLPVGGRSWRGRWLGASPSSSSVPRWLAARSCWCSTSCSWT